MIKLDNGWVHSCSNKEYPYPQVQWGADGLLKTIRLLGEIARPRHFRMTSCALLRFESVPSNGRRHSLQVHGDEPIDEVYTWQVYGVIDGRTVNVVAESIFHTHKENRSGSGEWFINGKDAHLREDLGGLAKDDIWQDSNKWQHYPQWTKIPIKEAK